MRASKEQRRAMLDLIEQWQQSGVSQKDFYQQKNIPAHVFYYWHKCYREQKSIIPKLKPANPFVELKPSAVLVAANIEMQLSSGHRIIFHQPVSADYLKALMG